jgi:hypothetical protein
VLGFEAQLGVLGMALGRKGSRVWRLEWAGGCHPDDLSAESLVPGVC